MAALTSYSASLRRLHTWWLSTLSDKLSRWRLEGNILQTEKKFYSVTTGELIGRVWLVMPAAFLQPTPGRCLSQTSARQVPQALVLPLEAFCLPWNKILNKQGEEKLSVSLWAADLHRQVTVLKFSIIFSVCKRKSRDGWCSSCRFSPPARQTFQAYTFIVRLLRDLTLIKRRNLIH